MSKLKKLVMCVLAVCTVSCLSFATAACDKNSNYPNYINPSQTDKPVTPEEPSISDTDPDAPYSGTYNVSIKSLGGLPLNKVMIAAKKDGITLAEGVSINGVVSFMLEKGEYELEIKQDSLPAGYYVPEGQTFKTNAELANSTIALPSTIIPSVAASTTRYSVGDVIYDFSFTEVSNSTRYSLSQLFNNKKAVVLNFFYTTCGPCQSEFKPFNAAYENYEDEIAVIALADTSHDRDFDALAEFKQNMKLSFNVGQDMTGIANLFSVEAFPTTVIIDRYGVIAAIHKGAITSQGVWMNLFDTYTADDYDQSGVTENPDDEEGDSQELVKPNVQMSDPAAIASAINGEGTNKKVGLYTPETGEQDAEFSWPWIVQTESDGNCITASNVSVGPTFAIIYTTLTLETGDILSYEYNVNTESGQDVMYVLIDKEIIAEYSGDSNGWQTESAVYIAKRNLTVEFAISYVKNKSKEPEGERASIRNITIKNAESYTDPLDEYVSAVSGSTQSGKYENYLNNLVLSAADGYYHVGGEDGPILFADILNTTAWSDLHIKSKYFTNPEGNMTTASMYLYSYWMMSNYKQASETVSLTFTYGHTDTILDNYYWQGFSKNGFVPVSEKLKAALIAFTEKYCLDNNESYYQEQWLELCYYGKHYGGNHLPGDKCQIDVDPIEALDFSNAYDLVLNQTAHVDVDVILKWNNGGGKFYKFVPETTGIYYFYSSYSTATGNSNQGTKADGSNSDTDTQIADPYVILYDTITTVSGVEHNIIGQYNNDTSPETFLNRNRYNFYAYAYLKAGETYYFQCRDYVPGTLIKFDFTIEYTGKTEMDVLRVCTTGEGLWTYDSNNNTYYLAIDVALNDGVYYEVLNDEFGSEIYIDFTNPNYYDNNNHTLLWMIENGYFDFGVNGDYTATMRQFYNASIAGKSETDELYGKHVATEELVNVLTKYFNYAHGEGKMTGYWLSLAIYYQHIGA